MFELNSDASYSDEKTDSYKAAVGGSFEKIGQAQLRFLMNVGINPSDVLLDLACGSLRLGSLIIPYLHEGNYLGIDQHDDLIQEGIHKELSVRKYHIYKPEFVVNDQFDFSDFTKQPDIVIAQSIFTHLSRVDIVKCLKSLYGFMKDTSVLYASFRKPVKTEKLNDMDSHMHACFDYTKHQILKMGSQFFNIEFLGQWGHPRFMVMAKYTKKIN